MRPGRCFIASSLLFIGLWASPAGSYKISVLGRYHERMTVLAQRCMTRPEFPAKCTMPVSVKAFKKVPYHEGDYWLASRWSDDPTLQASSTGLFKFVWNVGFNRCVNYIGEFNDFPGVLCGGHFGTLQFLHSMASIQDGERVEEAGEEPRDLTKEKIVGWTEFAFKVATGAQSTGEPYCQAVRKYGAAGVALASPRFPFCDKWTAGTIFGFSCKNPLRSDTCKTDIPDAKIRNSATGALLHMIQDSYSRSHAGREEDLPDGPYADPARNSPTAEVRCKPVKSFYRYTLEQSKVHGEADKAPVFSEECSAPDTMDPITASARMIWLVENKCDAGWAKDLIDRGVIENLSSPFPKSNEACRLAPGGQAT